MSEKRIAAAATRNLRSGVRTITTNAQQGDGTRSQNGATALTEKRIAALAVRDLCAGISDMTLWRWQHDPKLNFPAPIYIARRRYWREADIIAWLDSQGAELAV